MKRSSNWLATYRPTRGLGIAVALLIGAVSMLLVLNLAFEMAALGLVDRLIAGVAVSEAEVIATITRLDALGLATRLVFLVAGITFLVWFYRMYQNLCSLGARDMRFGKGWAFWGWIVPILNLWRPKQIINDIWRASDPKLPLAATEWRQNAVPGYWVVWWLAFVVWGWPGGWTESQTPAEVRGDIVAGIASDALGLVAGALAILVVVSTSARQEERARMDLSSVPGTPAAALTAAPPPSPPLPSSVHVPVRTFFSGRITLDVCGHELELRDVELTPQAGNWRFCTDCREGRRIASVEGEA